MSEYQVDLEPVGRRTTVPAGATLLDAAQKAGVTLIAVCGGEGTCQECIVRLVSGKLSPLSLVEEATFNPDEIRQGFRLACQAEPLSHVKIEIPAESLTAPQRLQVEGQEEHVPLEPLVVPMEIQLPPPSLTDLRADTTRLREVLEVLGAPAPVLDLPAMVQFSEQMRSLNWVGRLARQRSGRLVSTLPAHAPLFGLAVDVGTTKLAAYLVNLETGDDGRQAGRHEPPDRLR